MKLAPLPSVPLFTWMLFHLLLGLIALHMDLELEDLDLEPSEGKLCPIHSIPTSYLRPRRGFIG
jgi:hypothetical protein